MCKIQTNPDAAGVGIQIAVYMNAFLPLVSMMIELLRGQSLVENDNLREGNILLAKTSLLTAMALIISAIVQSHKYGLSVFDALIVLNLCWISLVGGFTPMLSAMTSPEHIRRLARHWGERPYSLRTILRRLLNTFFDLPPTLEWLYLLYCNCMLMSGFGIWVMRNPLAFDRSMDACTSTTVFWIMGHSVNITDSRFRTALLVLYGLFLVPGLNVLIILSIWWLAYFTLWILARLLLGAFCCIWCDTSLSFPPVLAQEPSVEGPWEGFIPIPFAIMQSLLVLITHKTINANNTGPEDGEWHLGQIFTLVIAALPVISMLRQFKSCRPSEELRGDGGPNQLRGRHDVEESGVSNFLVRPRGSEETGGAAPAEGGYTTAGLQRRARRPFVVHQSFEAQTSTGELEGMEIRTERQPIEDFGAQTVTEGQQVERADTEAQNNHQPTINLTSMR
ncbi:hypothetical protein DL93DRAFT_788101 [Clavulina sp. PMI_390]|nr:hypothetical protein DL93DRAFT_788101 [Clavulina sp. PMI_390]